MICRFETVLRDVAAALGESPELDLICSADEKPLILPLRSLVGSYLPIAAADILSTASLADIDTDKSFAAKPERTGPDSGMLPLPGDFFRLTAFRMPDWRTDETNVTDERLLIARCKGRIPDELRRMRTADNPYLRIARHPEGLRLHFYGTSDPEAHPSSALYIARPRWRRAENSIPLPEALYPSIIAATAAKIREIP